MEFWITEMEMNIFRLSNGDVYNNPVIIRVYIILHVNIAEAHGRVDYLMVPHHSTPFVGFL